MTAPIFKSVALVVALAVAGADAQALTDAQFKAFSACNTAMTASCVSKSASCTTTLAASVVSGGITKDQLVKAVADAAVCQTSFAAAVVQYNPTSKRRLSDSLCPSDCQDEINCEYNSVMPCLDKINGLPSGLTSAFGTLIVCSAKSQQCDWPFACPLLS